MKAVFSFICSIIIAAFLAYMITGSGGIFVLTLLLLAMIVDLIIAALSSKNLRVTAQIDSQTVNKGDEINFIVTPDNGSFMPSGIVILEVNCSANLTIKGDKIYRFITAGRNGEPIKIPVIADYSGKGSVYIESLYVMDFLGVRKKRVENESLPCTVKVLPNIPDTGTQTELIKTVSDNMTFDDSEEETEEASLTPTGIAGYEHRQYVPGDPLKRINWKISSKKNTLMVRLDDKSVSSSQVFVLDYPQSANMGRDYIKNADIIIEASLAMLNMLIRQGYESEYYLFIDNNWECIKVNDEKSLQYLQERISGIIPTPVSNRIPSDNSHTAGKSKLYFTACLGFMENEINQLKGSFSGALAVSKFSGITKQDNIDVWCVDENYQFTKL